ncbi:HAD family hydrolase [Poriferisphaera sp. WC338]|uniref:HAD family hydrolase n=1 Tax=Poriferisphaera sp. WC338 TaxID=3425129 RepID=UPI003D81B673
MIAIDIDGTLLGSDGVVPRANAEAIGRAMDAGVMVIPCTGRGWRESGYVIEQVDAFSRSDQHGIFVTGAMVSELATGKSVEIAAMEPALAAELIAFLGEQPEAVLAYRDAGEVGHDYLVTGSCELVGNTDWWFQKTGAKVHTQADVCADDLHAVLRVGMVAKGARLAPLTELIEAKYGDRVLVQHFMGVQMPNPEDTVYILEVFAGGVDKWRGVRWISEREGIEPEKIACIGDEINDVAMLKAAGLGVAMGNAVPEAAVVADKRTLRNDDGGVAHAIEMMLDGKW